LGLPIQSFLILRKERGLTKPVPRMTHHKIPSLVAGTFQIFLMCSSALEIVVEADVDEVAGTGKIFALTFN